jgi:hypothetical protein
VLRERSSMLEYEAAAQLVELARELVRQYPDGRPPLTGYPLLERAITNIVRARDAERRRERQRDQEEKIAAFKAAIRGDE